MRAVSFRKMFWSFQSGAVSECQELWTAWDFTVFAKLTSGLPQYQGYWWRQETLESELKDFTVHDWADNMNFMFANVSLAPQFLGASEGWAEVDTAHIRVCITAVYLWAQETPIFLALIVSKIAQFCLRERLSSLYWAANKPSLKEVSNF